jgi:hypothetical protein
LTETKTFSDTVSKSKNKFLVETLYLVVSLKDKSSSNTYLIAMPKELVRVLIATFTTTSRLNPLLPTASDIIPTSVTDNKESYFCLVRNPSYQPKMPINIEGCSDDLEDSPPMPYAFLFQFTCDDREDEQDTRPQTGGGGGGGGKLNKSQWDSTILWNFCRWRSCMCPATSSPAPKYLCTHHSMLKALLDSTSKKKNESARFLPRKPPVCSDAEVGTTKRDLLLIKAASSLVEELVDDKLASTIESFCHRMKSDHGLLRQKHWSKFNLKENNREATWKRWGTPGVLKQTLGEMEQNNRAASASFALEHATTLEIQNLVNRGIYPVAEVALIQKELKNDVESSQQKFELISSLVHHVKS